MVRLVVGIRVFNPFSQYPDVPALPLWVLDADQCTRLVREETLRTKDFPAMPTHEMTTEETIAFLEGHCDPTFQLAKQLANCISYENGVELNALRMMRLLDPVMRDKARLDAVQDHALTLSWNDLRRAFTVQKRDQVVGNIGWGTTAREAIDEARKIVG